MMNYFGGGTTDEDEALAAKLRLSPQDWNVGDVDIPIDMDRVRIAVEQAIRYHVTLALITMAKDLFPVIALRGDADSVRVDLCELTDGEGCVHEIGKDFSLRALLIDSLETMLDVDPTTAEARAYVDHVRQVGEDMHAMLVAREGGQ